MGCLKLRVQARFWYVCVLVTLLCTVLVTGCSLFGEAPTSQTDKSSPLPPTGNIDPTVHNVEVDILNNIKAYGFNSDPSINNGLGGLWVNWRYGTNPLQTNINGTGETDSDSGNTLRHDPLTDLRYLHNLWSYKVQNPDDHNFDSEIERYTPIIKHEFNKTHNERGWLYDEFNALFHLSHDSFYRDATLSLATSYARAFKPAVGTIYKVDSSHPMGMYRVDLTLESGCALIQAGTQSNNPQWLQAGKSIVNFVYAHAYIASYHAFPDQVDNVLLPGGGANPQEPFFLGHQKNYTVNGSHMQMGSISQIIVSLLDTYQVTHEQDFLDKATSLLDSLSVPGNILGMWDNHYGGYYFSANFQGISPLQPGFVAVDKKHKEAGRQAIMLQAFHLADKFTNNKYKAMEDLMVKVSLQHIYNASVHGVLYEVNADWSPLVFHNKTLDNMTTTEAMGAELESLFSLG